MNAFRAAFDAFVKTVKENRVENAKKIVIKSGFAVVKEQKQTTKKTTSK